MSDSDTPKNNTWARIYAALKLLERNRAGIPNVNSEDGIFPRVREIVPLSDHEMGQLSGGTLRGDAAFSFESSSLVRAGWITKKDGVWRITEAGIAALDTFPDSAELRRELRRILTAERKTRLADRAEALRTTIVSRSPDEDRIREVAQLFVERGLRENESVFAPGRSVWVKECFEELKRAFIDTPDETDKLFKEKLPEQMEAVSDDARLLMAEIITWQFLPLARAIGKRAKDERVTTALNTMRHPVQVPAEIASAFSAGVANPGRTMVNDQYWTVVLLLNLLGSWLEKDPEEQDELLMDPWAWKRFVLSIPGKNIPTQRSALLYLVHPESFINVFSAVKKQQIRDTFIGEISGTSGDIDRDLFAITIALQQKTDAHVDYYDEQYRTKWDPTFSVSGSDESNRGDSEEEEDELPVAPELSRRPFPAASQTLAEKVHIPVPWLQKQLELLERRRQVIYYGPPGTGKTYLAMAIADYVTGNERYTRLVQFHPSYSYEDFFEGYRPVTDEHGQLSYKLTHGPLRRMVDEALENPEYNYVLVIDEINRGNLAKIFGELYFLLEYRRRQINLQYSSEPFELPENLFIIGTMNTSDRSIALMDAAMRRRFAFVELHPDIEPVSGVLPRWLAANQQNPEAAPLLKQLNLMIEDPDFRIGPSYLMPKDKRLDEDTLRQVWEHEIMPLLEEHHYGQRLDLSKKYGLPALRAVLKQRAQATEGDAGVVNAQERETLEPDAQTF